MTNHFDIEPVNNELRESLQAKINSKTKPLGALGRLEQIALQIGLVQQTLTPRLSKPTVLLFAGDHGLVAEGVSPYPQDVTFQMVYNFLAGGAAINVFARQHQMGVTVVDAGVNHSFPDDVTARPDFIPAKIGMGTQNMRYGPAMTTVECEAAIAAGANVVGKVVDSGANVIAFGEMGIGNTSSSALILSLLAGHPVADCVGRGTGVDDDGLQRKIAVLEAVLAFHQARWGETPPAPLEVLASVGGFEIAQMVGGMLEAASRNAIIMVDGFISTAAFMIAQAINPVIKAYAFFSHLSNEQAHRKMIDYLDAEPLLSLEMRLGEGSGAAVAYPLLVSGVDFLNDMATFESAGVSES